MLRTVLVTPDQRTVIHRMLPPAVYLDHWALVRIAMNEADRFAEALRKRGGTLAFSWINLLEFVDGKSPKVIKATEDLLRKLIPDSIAFLEVDPGVVIDREDGMLRGGPRVAPDLDEALFRDFLLLPRPGLDPLDPAGFVERIRDHKVARKVRARWRELVDKFQALFERARADRKTNRSVRQRIESPPGGRALPQPTRHVLVEVMKQVIRRDMDLSVGNHWRDFFHTVVPLAYCDFVLVDKHWLDISTQTQRQLEKRGLWTGTASVFSERTFADFWSALENPQGRPRELMRPHRLSLYVDADFALDLKRLAAHLGKTGGGVPISVSQAVVQVVRNSRQFQAMKKLNP